MGFICVWLGQQGEFVVGLSLMGFGDALTCAACSNTSRQNICFTCLCSVHHGDVPPSTCRGHPDMNSLIALGVATAFGTGLASAFVPGIPLDASLLEEPVMLLAFVLLGRTLEARARKKASGEWRNVIIFFGGVALNIRVGLSGQPKETLACPCVHWPGMYLQV